MQGKKLESDESIIEGVKREVSSEMYSQRTASHRSEGVSYPKEVSKKYPIAGGDGRTKVKINKRRS